MVPPSHKRQKKTVQIGLNLIELGQKAWQSLSMCFVNSPGCGKAGRGAGGDIEKPRVSSYTSQWSAGGKLLYFWLKNVHFWSEKLYFSVNRWRKILYCWLKKLYIILLREEIVIFLIKQFTLLIWKVILSVNHWRNFFTFDSKSYIFDFKSCTSQWTGGKKYTCQWTAGRKNILFIEPLEEKLYFWFEKFNSSLNPWRINIHLLIELLLGEKLYFWFSLGFPNQTDCTKM